MAVDALVERHYFDTSSACPVEEEGSGFMAICTNWAWLVGEVMAPEPFEAWLADFLPQDRPFTPIDAPRNAHEYGMNFSRAWGFAGLYRLTGDARWADTWAAHVEATYARRDHWDGDYGRVAHWVAQFGMLAVTSFEPSLACG